MPFADCEFGFKVTVPADDRGGRLAAFLVTLLFAGSGSHRLSSDWLWPTMCGAGCEWRVWLKPVRGPGWRRAVLLELIEGLDP
jgi:hypothetical protein